MTGLRSQVTDGYVSRSAAKQDIIYQKRAQHVRWQDSNGAYIKEASGYERDNLQQNVSVRSFLTYGFSGREKRTSINDSSIIYQDLKYAPETANPI